MISCKQSRQDRKNQFGQSERASRPYVNQSDLIGTWYLNQWDLYHTIYIQDSTHIVIENHIDTLFFYEYALKEDTLFLYKKYGQLVAYHPILTLTKDSLIFDGFLDKPGIQGYCRTKLKKQEKAVER